MTFHHLSVEAQGQGAQQDFQFPKAVGTSELLEPRLSPKRVTSVATAQHPDFLMVYLGVLGLP